MKAGLSALIVMAAGAVAPAPAGAADLAPRLPPPVVAPFADVEYRITPFFWMAGLDGEIGTRRNLPSVDVDVKFGDILRNLDFAAMLAGEYRNGRWGLLADLTYVAVSLDGARDVRPRAPGFTSATLKSRQRDGHRLLSLL
jgi:hypothetical protein